MAKEAITIEATDGPCPAQVFTPEGGGSHPGVIFFMDGLGIRPTLGQMAQRLADAGYVVLLPDMYYRAGPQEPLVPAEVFASGDVMGVVGPLMGTTGNQRAALDAAAFIAYLAARSDVAGTKIGTTGYCMGGGMSLSVAGTYPGHVAAAASFHGGRLATDEPDSPHLLAPSIKGRVYVAAADHDEYYPPEMAERLEKSLTDAGVDHRCETYPEALHGFTMADFPVYDEAAAERHWRELLALYDAVLR